jgi:hypothetical protein
MTIQNADECLVALKAARGQPALKELTRLTRDVNTAINMLRGMIESDESFILKTTRAVNALGFGKEIIEGGA